MSLPNRIYAHVDLQAFHTLACPSFAEYAVIVTDKPSLLQTLGWAHERSMPVQILGEGSNVVPAAKVPGLTIINRLGGVKVINNEPQHIDVKVASGVSWHWLVMFASAQGWFGIENLALIPGTVGAAPVQNIGAYGVEFRDVFVELTAIHVDTGEQCVFDAAACCFGYRESVFKQEASGQWCIVDVTLRLLRQFNPLLSYGPLAQLQPRNSTELIKAVMQIRQEKLPDPGVIPNAGSFFTNPLVDAEVAQQLKLRWPELPIYAQKSGQKVKLAAGWLIEHAGLKGRYSPHTGIGAYEKQALVLINPQRASARAVMAEAQVIVDAVQACFGVQLTPEPRQFP